MIASFPDDPFPDLEDAIRCHLLSHPPPVTPTSASSDPPATSLAFSLTEQLQTFSGSEDDCEGFVLRCSLVFSLWPHLYPTERSRVAFLVSWLHGPALLWVTDIWLRAAHLFCLPAARLLQSPLDRSDLQPPVPRPSRCRQRPVPRPSRRCQRPVLRPSRRLPVLLVGLQRVPAFTVAACLQKVPAVAVATFLQRAPAIAVAASLQRVPAPGRPPEVTSSTLVPAPVVSPVSFGPSSLLWLYSGPPVTSLHPVISLLQTFPFSTLSTPGYHLIKNIPVHLGVPCLSVTPRGPAARVTSLLSRFQPGGPATRVASLRSGFQPGGQQSARVRDGFQPGGQQSARVRDGFQPGGQQSARVSDGFQLSPSPCSSATVSSRLQTPGRPPQSATVSSRLQAPGRPPESATVSSPEVSSQPESATVSSPEVSSQPESATVSSCLQTPGRPPESAMVSSRLQAPGRLPESTMFSSRLQALGRPSESATVSNPLQAPGRPPEALGSTRLQAPGRPPDVTGSTRLQAPGRLPDVTGLRPAPRIGLLLGSGPLRLNAPDYSRIY
ncbi:methyl-CpG-binding domain protein 6-like [Siniperca chuatsi]|uniref:methyl-CpG-binding domain protein 6-like n=1 Tax=Siniperca chuatsi TaxID=119488 RepID=UPI001CE168A1|nr:methyl-CpG-binding domain protein 6-like [Siniperca chuatsi]